MKIGQKLILGFVAIAFFVGLVGYLGIKSSRQVLESFGEHEEHYRDIIAKATEVSSYAKRAEGHLLLYLSLHDERDREKFFKRYESLKEQIKILNERVRTPEDRATLDSINLNAEKLLPLGRALIEVHEKDMEKTGRFEFEKHSELIRQFHNITSSLRKQGIELAHIKTDFLNKQEAITAATEVSSYAKRAEGHLLLYLSLHDERDREKFFKRYESLKEQIKILNERVRTPETKTILDSINLNAEKLLPLGRALIEVYEKDMEKTGRFEFEKHSELIRQFHDIASSLRKQGVELAIFITDLEIKTKVTAIKNAKSIQSKIFTGIMFTVMIALLLGLSISRSISNRVIKLKDAIGKVGKGELDTLVRAESKDEIGQLASAFQQMTEDLKKTTVSRDEMSKEITERRRVEEALLQEKHRLENVTGFANCGLLLLDDQARVTYANRVSEEWFGPFHQIKGELCWKIFNLKDPEKECAGLEVLRTGKTIRSETFIKAVSGKDKFFYVIASPIKDNNGKVHQITVVVIDITERKRYEEKIQFQLNRLNALRSIDRAITASLDLRVTLDIFLDEVTTQLGIDSATVLLLNPRTQILEYVVSRGFRTSALKYTKLRLGESNAGRAAIERRIITIPNLKEMRDGFVRSELFTNEDFITYFAVPLIAKGQVKGVLEVFHRSPLDPDPEWLEFLEIIAGQGAIVIDNATLFDGLQRSNIELILAYDTTIEGWSRAMDLRDKETEGHTQRVTDITLRIARELGVKEKELVHIRRGALLHDMGKMGIPDSILLKPGPLTDEEWKIMKLHPVYAYDMLYPIEYLRPALDIPHYHHEKWDGTGYPKGLKGEEIPLAARIFAVVDVWDALRSDRPYRPAWPKEKVLEHIRSLSGTHFDSEVVEVFLKMGW